MKNKSLLVFISALSILFSSCSPLQKKTMKIQTYPNKTDYEVGDVFSLKGLEIIDSSSRKIITEYTSNPLEGYVFTEQDLGEPISLEDSRCPFKVTISKESYVDLVFTVTVRRKLIDKTIRIVSLPDVTAYEVGDVFSKEGLTIYDEYLDTLTDEYDLSINEGYVFKESDVGNKTIYVTKAGYSSYLAFIISVSSPLVNAKEEAIESIKSYYNNLPLDLYSEANKELLSEYLQRYINLINNALDVEEVKEFLDDAINLMNNVPTESTVQGLFIEKLPLRTTFTKGDEFNYNGLKVCLDLGKGAKKEITNYEIIPPNMDVVGDNVEVKVKYEELEASFNVKVVSPIISGKKTFKVFSTNDIHGQVEEQRGSRASTATVMSYLKQQRENENVILLDQGDTWQGSIYSNINHGAILTDVMNYVRYDARTVGNHDFDWGAQYITKNKDRIYDGYITPTLAANVYDYDFDNHIVGKRHLDEVGDYVTSFTLENGLKIGVIGTIGKAQITSISTIYSKDFTFTDHIEVIKNEAERLKDEGCKFIIASTHAGQEDLLNNGLENYVDLALCAHTHMKEQTYEGDLLYYQGGSYNQYVGDIEITYDCDTNKVSFNTIKSISAYEIKNLVEKTDSNIESIIDKYNTEVIDAAKEVVASNVSGEFYSSGALPNVMCSAVFDRAIQEGYEIDLAYCNSARASLYSSVWTYADLYQTFPFDNLIYIIEVSYNEMRNEIGRYNYVCRSDNFDGNIQWGQTYKVACIDFLAFHTNSNRYYDYFSDNNGNYLGVLSTNYRLILKEWLIENRYSDGKLLSQQDFINSEKYSRDFTFSNY